MTTTAWKTWLKNWEKCEYFQPQNVPLVISEDN